MSKKKSTGSKLGRFSGMTGTIATNAVEPAKPIKGIVGKGFPKTCNASITKDMQERALKAHQAKVS